MQTIPRYQNHTTNCDGTIFMHKKKVLKTTLDTTGYVRNTINKKTELRHRLVYEAFVGPIPVGEDVDHIDLNKSNNHYLNLRAVSKSDNSLHRGTPRNNTSGFKNVCWNQSSKKWCIRFRANGKYVFCEHIDDFDDACLIASEFGHKNFPDTYIL
jgi:hypothetical protein